MWVTICGVACYIFNAASRYYSRKLMNMPKKYCTFHLGCFSRGVEKEVLCFGSFRPDRCQSRR